MSVKIVMRLAICVMTSILALSSSLQAVSLPPPPYLSLAMSQGPFSWKVYHELAKQPGNIFISPFSLSQALGMTYVGAQGNTKKEIGKLLGLTDWSDSWFCEANSDLCKMLPPGFESFQAAAVGCSLQSSYQALLKQKFKAEFFEC